MAKKIAIIGAGPGGYVCAIRAAQLGNRVVLIDRNPNPGGTCLNVGCIPSKNLLHVSGEYFRANREFANLGIIANVSADYEAIQAQKRKAVSDLCGGVSFLLKKNGVRFVAGEAKIISPKAIMVAGETIEADAIVIATGSEPRAINGIAIDEKVTVSSTGALEFTHPPQSLAVIGGGYIGLELGSVWQRFGTKVTVIEASDRIAPNLDEEVGQALFRVLVKHGMEFELSSKVLKVATEANGAKITIASGAGEKTLMADKVLVAVGRVPRARGLGLENAGVTMDARGYIEVDADFATASAGVYAIGDVIQGPMLAHKAEEEGYALAESLSGNPSRVDYDVIPSIVYTSPEVASVGFTERELAKAGVPYKSSKFPFTANSRAKATHDTTGFVKLLSHAESGLLLGAHVIGSLAGAMIAEPALALSKRLKIEDLAKLCHAHPTHGEAVKEAALMGFSQAVHA